MIKETFQNRLKPLKLKMACNKRCDLGDSLPIGNMMVVTYTCCSIILRYDSQKNGVTNTCVVFNKASWMRKIGSCRILNVT